MSKTSKKEKESSKTKNTHSWQRHQSWISGCVNSLNSLGSKVIPRYHQPMHGLCRAINELPTGATQLPHTFLPALVAAALRGRDLRMAVALESVRLTDPLLATKGLILVLRSPKNQGDRNKANRNYSSTLAWTACSAAGVAIQHQKSETTQPTS